MAAIGATQITQIAADGGAQKCVLYRISNVTSGDTLDVSSVGPITLKKVQGVGFIGAAQGTQASGSISGTTITFTSSGMAADTIYACIVGEG